MNDTLSTAPAAIVAIAGTAYAAINDVAILHNVPIGVARERFYGPRTPHRR